MRLEDRPASLRHFLSPPAYRPAMAASRRVSPAAARPPGSRAPRARGRRRRPSLWRRVLLALPRPTRVPFNDPTAAIQHEVHELRLAVASLRAEVAELHGRLAVPASAAPDQVVDLRDPAAVTLVLPLARAAAMAGVPADGVVSLDLGPDTAETEIMLTPAIFPAAAKAPAATEAPAGTKAPAPALAAAAVAVAHQSVAPRVTVLPEAPLLDPRLARVAEAIDDLLGDDGAEHPVGAAQRETA